MADSHDNRIAAIYPLSPMQEGLVFHTLFAPGSGVYAVQKSWTLDGDLEPALLRQAWQQVVDRHAALRSLFVLDEGSEPLQVVMAKAQLSWRQEDWRGICVGEQQRRLAAWLEEDGARSFDVAAAPLMRLALFRLAEDVHVLVLAVHHAVLDGWSLQVVCREVAQIYEGLRRGRPAALPRPAPYEDFIAWLGEQDQAAAGAYWREALAGVSGPTPLGLEEPPAPTTTASATAAVAEVSVTLPRPTSAALVALGRRYQLTMNTWLHGAWALLMGRYSGAAEVTYGAIQSIRPEAVAGIESMVGLLIGAQPARVRIAFRASLVEWLGDLQLAQAEARQHSFASLVQVKEWSGVPRDQELFDTLLVYENYPAARPDLEAPATLRWRRRPGFDVTHYPLNVVVQPGDALKILLTYDPQRYRASAIVRLGGHLCNLLTAMAADPERPAGALPLLDVAERHQLLHGWNDTDSAYPRHRAIHQLFEEQAVRRRSAVAVVFGERQLTYGELDARANRLAHYLIRRGAGPEVRVGICVRRSPEMVVGILAILKAGGAYVPLDPDYPKPRLAYMLADTAAPVLLTEESLVAELPEHRARVVRLDADWPRIAEESAAPPPCRVSAENLAYVIYTSGSTGRPKGAAVVHRSVVRLVRETGYVELDEDEVLLQFAPISFDASTFELWGSLLSGARLVVFPPHKPSLEELGRSLAEQRITTLWLTSALFQQMVGTQLERLGQVRQLLAGGETLPVPHVERALATLGGEHRLINGYGPTENTTFTCCHPMTRASRLGRTVPIGRPIANTRVVLLDEGLSPVPVGAVGELWTSGDGLARCYLHDAALTAHRFVPDPFSPVPGGRLYRVGDQARYLADGNVEFLGRKDHQVKLRGYRIELGEVETALCEHRRVGAAAALVVEDSAGEKELAAFVVGREGAQPAGEELRRHLHQHLPRHMVPSRWFFLEELPLTPNDKVDRAALGRLVVASRPAEAPPEHPTGGGTPRSQEEELLADIWSEVLGVGEIGVDEDFFELGGHSLKATRVISRLRSTFGVELPLQELFEQPTVATLAARVARARGEAPAAPPIPRRTDPEDRPLSFAQERLWFLDQLETAGGAYNLSLPRRLLGSLNRAALAAGLGAILGRHEALRTRFVQRRGRPETVIEGTEARLSEVDLSALPREGREGLARRLVEIAAGTPFDLAAGPLLRCWLLHLDAGDHILVVATHHIVADGWSLGVLERELAALYNAAAGGGPGPAHLAPLPIAYADFARWQRDWLRGEVQQAQLAFWRRQLAAAPALELPTDRPRAARQSFRGEQHRVTVDAGLAGALGELSREERVTLFMTTLAAFGTLLHRSTGQDDLVLGTVTAYRRHRELEGLIGFFANTLALRLDLSGGELTFRQLLERTREVALGAFAHQDLPFEMLVQALEPERDLSRNPIFQVFFALQNTPAEPLELTGLEVRPLARKSRHTHFDLELDLTETDGALAARFIYNRDLFDGATIAAMAGHLQVLLAGVVTDPDRRLWELPVLAPAEHQQLLVSATGTAISRQGPTLLHELVAAQAARTPGAVAAVCGGARWTYGELAARAAGVSRRLRRLGIGPDVPVALCVERSLGMLAGLLGILEAGGAYVPLDPSHPAERLLSSLADSRAAVLLSQREVLERLPALREDGALTVLCLDEEPTAVPATADPGLGPAGVRPENLAYVIYTSGSTGRPKGVQITHRSAVSFLAAMAEAPGLTASDRLAAVTTLSFDIAVLELLLPLTVGARVVIVPRAVAADGQGLAQLLTNEQITVLQATPATWQLLLQGSWRGAPELKMLCGGEALPRSLADALLAGGGELWNLYGPTETTVWSTVARVAGDRVAGDRRPVCLGRPIAGTSAWVLDAHLQPVPTGAVGELYLGGAGLARGYRARPGLTAASFVPAPRFSGPSDSEPGRRLYRTGDRARWDTHGRLLFLGRADHQIKLRGFRIEPGEIEAALERHPAVTRAVVMVVGRDAVDRRLTAFVVASRGAAPGAAQLRESLGRSLPEHMVPTSFVVLESLPLSPSGKVDRAALERLAAEHGAAERHADGKSYTALRGPVEEAVAGAFAEVLERPVAGGRDHFFALGGHSLLATRLLSRLRDALRVELPLSAVFEAPTVEELAERVEVARQGEGRLAAGPIAPLPRRDGLPRDAVPLSFGQRRLWFLDQLGTGAAYNMKLSLELDGELDIAVLRASLERIVRRHEILRTTFTAVGGQPRQVVARQLRIPLAAVDLGHLVSSVGSREVRRLALGLEARPFDLARGPLLRAALVRLEDRRHVLLLVFHHIVCDGGSLGLLRRELAAWYRGLRHGEETGLPALPVQFADFAVWHNTWLASEAVTRQLDFWKERLGSGPAGAGELPVLSLPTDRPRPAVQTFRGASHAFDLEPRSTAELRALSRGQGVTLAMALLAAFKVLLCRITGQHDIVVGAPIAGRNHRQVEDLIGFFVNSLVLRSNLAGAPAFSEALRRVQRVALAAYDHQDLPFERLVDELVPERDMAQTPLFQVVFAMRTANPWETVDADLTLAPYDTGVGSVRTDLELHLLEHSTGLACRLVYNTDLFDTATAARLASHFVHLAEAAAAAPETRLWELAMLAPAERRQLVGEWSATGRPSAQACLHELIAAHVREVPERLAVIYDGAARRELTYRELDEEANRIAHLLRGMGVGPDDRVALLAERGPDLVAALLGILKAGGAYVPLDPAYPRDRLAFMLGDSRAKVLVSEQPLLAGLPETASRPGAAPVLCLDRDRARIAAAPATPPEPLAAPRHLAYVIYTSGSTGLPKGTLVEHRGLASLADAQAQAFGAAPGSRVLQFSSLSFDASTFEVVMALSHGATLVLGPREAMLPGPDLVAFLHRNRVSIVTLPPTALLASPAEDLPQLATITVAGEACPAELVERWAGGRRFFNLYGPTEATIWSTMAELRPGSAAPSVGRPIAGTEAYLVGAHLEPVPVGVPGEMVLGGVGLARGYLGRPGLTAERFVPHPLAGQPGERLYRTGDLARFRPDGEIDFLGRLDHQVKLRGFRIELGEVEAVLAAHPAVRESLALVREDRPGDRRLVAYVVGEDAGGLGESAGEGWQDEHVSRWQSLYDGTYADAATPEERTFQIAGWNSSTTGEPIPAEEMHEWVERAVERILATGPQRVLEIGCGSGLLLFRIAPHCRCYLGTDLSQAALDTIAGALPGWDSGGAEIELERRAAHQLEDLGRERFDTVILNSVAQYFPSAGYLVRVLETASELVAPGGRIFVGDVRDLSLLEDFHTSVERARSAAEPAAGELRQRAAQAMLQEQELVVDPELFTVLAQRLPRLRGARMLAKDGRFDNELNRYRYDVVLEVAAPRQPGGAADRRPLAAWTNDPLRGRRLSQLVPRLRALAEERLPEFMVPSAVVVLDTWPLTPNGKIDRRALPPPEAPRPEQSDGWVAPRTAVERTLAEVWGRILNVERVGAEDNFFHLGGDSILSIQVVSAAREAGLHLSAKDVFQHQTVAELARVVGTRAAAVAEQGAVVGPVAPTPIAGWFFEQQLEQAHHFNQAMLLEASGRLDGERLQAVLGQLLTHHDALRLRCARQGAAWRQEIAEPGPQPVLEVVDLTAVAAPERAARIAAVAARTQESLDPVAGRNLAAVLFTAAEVPRDLLLVAIHHLAVDGVSWRVLLTDLERGLGQLERGESVALPPKTTSIREWAERLGEWARSPRAVEEAAYWLDLPWHEARGLPLDHAVSGGAADGSNTVGSMRSVEVTLGEDATAALLGELPAATNARVDEVLATALARAVVRWTGGRWAHVDLEGHGREEVMEGVDLSRTVGWLTAIYPVLLEVDPAVEPGEALGSVKEQLRRVPSHGLAFGAVRTLNDAAGEQLRRLPPAQIAFNYLGQLDQVLGGDALFRPAGLSAGPQRGPANRRAHLLEVGGAVVGGGLRMGFAYSRELHREETVERLAQGFLAELETLIAHGRSPSAGGPSAADLAEVGWSEDDLGELLAEVGELG